MIAFADHLPSTLAKPAPEKCTRRVKAEDGVNRKVTQLADVAVIDGDGFGRGGGAYLIEGADTEKPRIAITEAMLATLPLAP